MYILLYFSILFFQALQDLHTLAPLHAKKSGRPGPAHARDTPRALARRALPLRGRRRAVPDRDALREARPADC